jgi:antitoxin component HigA of HigAB toxin-antitoxin module
MNSLWYPRKIYFPIGAPDPAEAIKFRMEQGGLTVKDLEPIIGRSNRAHAEPPRVPAVAEVSRAII